MAPEKLGDQPAVADVAADERHSTGIDQVGDVLQIPCIGERIEHDHAASVCFAARRTKFAPMNPAPPVTSQ